MNALPLPTGGSVWDGPDEPEAGSSPQSPSAPVAPPAFGPLDSPEEPPLAGPLAPPSDDVPIVINRGRAAQRLLSRPEPEPGDDVIVQRHVLASKGRVRPQTSRERKIAGDLPEWEPLPPGELFVRRPTV